MRRSLICLVLISGASAQADAAPSRFEIRRLTVEGEVLALVPADLDGDGKLDLLAAVRTGLPPRQGRQLAVFWNRGRSFALRPDLTIPADPAGDCAFDVADVDGEKGSELLTIGPAGVNARSFRGRQASAPVALVRTPTLFHQPARGALPRFILAHELGAPGSSDLLIPAMGVLDVHHRGPGGYERTARLAVAMESGARGGGRGRARIAESIGPLHVSYTFPGLTVADTNADGKPDILLALEDRLAVHEQGPGFRFPEQPSRRRMFDVRSPAELGELSSSASITVTDIDGDRKADVVVRKQVARGITSATSTSFVYFGQGNAGYPTRPDQVIRSEGVGGSEVELHDVNGDGRTDLTVPSVNIGVMAMVRILTTKTVKVNFQVFPYDPSLRRFADRPAAERQLKFKVSLSGEAGAQAAEMRGDYNGDGRPDLAFGTDDDELSIFPGTNGPSLFDDDAVEEVEVPAFGSAESADLDRTGKSDLLLHYPRTKGLRNQLIVLINRGPW
jgi:hypothetical protein